jgi:hypothetical protein
LASQANLASVSLGSDRTSTERVCDAAQFKLAELPAELQPVVQYAQQQTQPFQYHGSDHSQYAGIHSFVDASKKDSISLVFRFFSEAVAPNTSACILVPDWPNARFNHYLKDSQILQQYPKGLGDVQYPLKLVYVPPRQLQCSALTGGSLSQLAMTFHGTAAGYPARIAADTLASHVFVSPEWIRRSGIHMQPMTSTVKLGDGKTEVKIIGKCTFRLAIGALHCVATGFVLSGLSADADIILGEDWLMPHKAVLDYGNLTMTVHKGQRRISVRAVHNPARQLESAAEEPFLISAMQAKKAIKRGSMHFLLVVKQASEQHAFNAEEIPMGEGPCDQDKLLELLEKYKNLSPAELPE